MKNSKRVRVLEVLLDVLNGECSNNRRSCPAEIYNNLFDNKGTGFFDKRPCETLSSRKWNCATCVKNFTGLNKEAMELFRTCHLECESKYAFPCPCLYLTFEECEARTKEMIKEYS